MMQEVLIASFAWLFLVISYSNAQQSCTTPEDQSGRCINIKQCPVIEDKVKRKNLSSEQKTFLRQFLCGFEGKFPKVCCPNSNNIRDYNKHFPKTTKLTKRTRCGERRPDGVINGIRVNEDQAKFGEFPWMVAILRKHNVQNREIPLYRCGGSLIHPRAVLTAAHCVRRFSAETLRIRAGAWDMRSTQKGYPHQDRDVETIIVHEGYYSAAHKNDYAILILSQPVEFTEAVDVICLPEKHMQFDHSRCLATGWGKNVYGEDGKEGNYQAILKKVDLPIVDLPTCQNYLRHAKRRTPFSEGYIRSIPESLICAGGEAGKDVCYGDGGSPLVCPIQNDPNRYYQAGIVVTGVGCGIENHPGLYANVAKARDWIDRELNARGFDNSYYAKHSN